MEKDAIRAEIREKIKQFVTLQQNEKKFVPGKSKVQYSGAVYDEREVSAIVDSVLDGWFGVSKKAFQFEEKLAKTIGTYGSIVTNSGSSANLLAVTALMNKKLEGHLKQGDEQ